LIGHTSPFLYHFYDSVIQISNLTYEQIDSAISYFNGYATFYSLLGMPEYAKDWFDHSAEMISKIQDEKYDYGKDNKWVDLGQSQAKAGLFEDAAQTAQKAKSPMRKYEIYRDIAENMIAKGKLVEACAPLTLAEKTIPDICLMHFHKPEGELHFELANLYYQMSQNQKLELVESSVI